MFATYINIAMDTEYACQGSEPEVCFLFVKKID